ncbi:unnamed protein product [Closterium sp. Naga37s-1]|nr:unnamed protein product [Closterium sp. Naga37s-1]
MERRALPLLCRLLLCATLCTAYGASAASLLAPILSHHGGSSAVASAASAAVSPSAASSTVNPSGSVVHGRLILKWVAHLRPAKFNGKVVGDRGASGKVKLKVVELTPSLYKLSYDYKIFSLRGGDAPKLGYLDSCFADGILAPATMVNITKPKTRRRRYSFTSHGELQANSESTARKSIESFTQSGAFAVVGREGNKVALCGKLKKKVN